MDYLPVTLANSSSTEAASVSGGADESRTVLRARSLRFLERIFAPLFKPGKPRFFSVARNSLPARETWTNATRTNRNRSQRRKSSSGNLQQNTVSMIVEELPLTFGERPNVDRPTCFDPHLLQGRSMRYWRDNEIAGVLKPDKAPVE